MKVNLFLFKNDGTSKVFALPSSVTVVGRRQDCDLCIPLMTISRRHCEMNMDGGQLRIRDLGTKNGIFINGERVDESIVNPGDVIGVGPVSFIVQINGNPIHVEPPLADGFIIPEPPQYRERISHHGETLVGTTTYNDSESHGQDDQLADNIQEKKEQAQAKN